jgi:hypothetical protein
MCGSIVLASIALGPILRSDDHESRRYPTLEPADLPLYPPLARLLHLTGTVEIKAQLRNDL